MRLCTQVMLKLRNARNLDARQNLLVDGAAHACKPAASLAPRRKQYPPLEAYLRHLLLLELFNGDVKKASLHLCMSVLAASGCLAMYASSAMQPGHCSSSCHDGCGQAAGQAAVCIRSRMVLPGIGGVCTSHPEAGTAAHCPLHMGQDLVKLVSLHCYSHFVLPNVLASAEAVFRPRCGICLAPGSMSRAQSCASSHVHQWTGQIRITQHNMNMTVTMPAAQQPTCTLSRPPIARTQVGAQRGCSRLRQASHAGQVARKVRKFPWEAHEALLVRCLLKALKGHYAQTAVIATCAASLARYHPSLSIHLTDVLLERVSLVICHVRAVLPKEAIERAFWHESDCSLQSSAWH